MKKRSIKIISFILMLIFLLSTLSGSASALDWDGESIDVGTGGSPADVNGYMLRFYPGDNCLGYRFSVVHSDGGNAVSTVIDVFRDTYWGRHAYTYEYKYTQKYNKMQLISNQTNSFSTAKTSKNCYLETEFDFITNLSTPDTMGSWQAYEGNLNEILACLRVGTVYDLNPGDKILVEPLYDIALQGVYHSLTVTEAAIYGACLLGLDSNGGRSSTAASWGFISVGPNYVYPNHLYTPDGQGLWAAATQLKKRTTFRNIINSGYGVGIAYAVEEDDTGGNMDLYSVTVDAPYRKGTTVITSYYVANWNGYDIDDGPVVSFYVRDCNGNLIYYGCDTSIAVPSCDSNLVYFTWDVPEDIDGTSVTLEADLYYDCNLITYVCDSHELCEYDEYTTPDTVYEAEQPSSYGGYNAPAENETTVGWQIYEYYDGDIHTTSYEIELSGTAEITPATGNSHYYEYGTWYMKSGYGISIEAEDSYNITGNSSWISWDMYTGAQYVTVLLPEFNYGMGDGQCVTLVKQNGVWVFPDSDGYGNVHFTPIWFPDGEYTVHVIFSDIWTPAGMVTVSTNATLMIKGNMYDDWYIGR